MIRAARNSHEGPMPHSSHASHAGPVVLLLACCLIPFAASPQAEPTLNDLVAQWSRGSFRSPLMCEVEGELLRGVRRVLIRTEKFASNDPQTSLELIDLDPGQATRCMDATGRQVPNLSGKLQLRRDGHRHPETARRDFKRALKQDKAFEFRIVSGNLRVQAVALPPAESRLLDFQGGRARLSLLFPATDAARALKDFPSGRKLVLTLESRSGEVFVLPLFDPLVPTR